jgi:hypothetical protein
MYCSGWVSSNGFVVERFSGGDGGEAAVTDFDFDGGAGLAEFGGNVGEADTGIQARA